MFKRTMATLVLASATLLVSPAQSQVGGGTQDEMVQQLQQMGAQMMQNMQQQGIDPVAFGQQMMEKMQDPTFDPADMQQMLIDQGILSQDMMTRMQGTVQRFALTTIKQRLNSSDAEWTVLQPKLQTLLTAMANVDSRGQNGSMAGFIGGQSNGEVSKALKDLRAAIEDPATPPEQLATKLRTWRAARTKAMAAWDAAEKDFIGVLTIGQETVLMDMGIIR